MPTKIKLKTPEQYAQELELYKSLKQNVAVIFKTPDILKQELIQSFRTEKESKDAAEQLIRVREETKEPALDKVNLSLVNDINEFFALNQFNIFPDDELVKYSKTALREIKLALEDIQRADADLPASRKSRYIANVLPGINNLLADKKIRPDKRPRRPIAPLPAPTRTDVMRQSSAPVSVIESKGEEKDEAEDEIFDAEDAPGDDVPSASAPGDAVSIVGEVLKNFETEDEPLSDPDEETIRVEKRIKQLEALSGDDLIKIMKRRYPKGTPKYVSNIKKNNLNKSMAVHALVSNYSSRQMQAFVTREAKRKEALPKGTAGNKPVKKRLEEAVSALSIVDRFAPTEVNDRRIPWPETAKNIARIHRDILFNELANLTLKQDEAVEGKVQVGEGLSYKTDKKFKAKFKKDLANYFKSLKRKQKQKQKGKGIKQKQKGKTKATPKSKNDLGKQEQIYYILSKKAGNNNKLMKKRLK